MDQALLDQSVEYVKDIWSAGIKDVNVIRQALSDNMFLDEDEVREVLAEWKRREKRSSTQQGRVRPAGQS